MKNGHNFQAPALIPVSLVPDKSFHPAWRAFVRYCADLQHGEIELLKIQDGCGGFGLHFSPMSSGTVLGVSKDLLPYTDTRFVFPQTL